MIYSQSRATTEANLKTLYNEVVKRRDEITQLDSRIQTLTDEEKRAKTNRNALQSQLNEINGDIKTSKEELARLKDDIKTQNTRVSVEEQAKRDELTNLYSEITKKRAEANQIASYIQQFGVVQARFNELTTSIAEKEREIGEKQDELSDYNALTTQAKEKLDKLEKESQKAEDFIQNAKNHKGDLNIYIRRLNKYYQEAGLNIVVPEFKF